MHVFFAGDGDLAGLFAPAHAVLRQAAGALIGIRRDAHGQLRRSVKQQQALRQIAVKAQRIEAVAFHGKGFANGLDLFSKVQAG